MNPNISYEPWVIIMYQYWHINCNKCTPLMLNVNNGRRESCSGIWELLYFLLNFSVNLKLLKKKKIHSFIFKIWIHIDTSHSKSGLQCFYLASFILHLHLLFPMLYALSSQFPVKDALVYWVLFHIMDFPGGTRGKESTCQCRRFKRV